MNIQVRLEKLAKKVEEKRNSGFVQSWSEDIKREAIFLARAVDFFTVVKVTKLHLSSLHNWKKEFPEENLPPPLSSTVEELQVTRFILQPQENRFPTKENPIAIMSKGDIEFKFFCQDLAIEIVKRVIL